MNNDSPSHKDAGGTAFTDWRKGRPFFLAPADLLRDGAFAGQSLPLRAFLMLLSVADTAGVTRPRQSEMAAHLGISHAPLSRAIDWLVDHGYVRKITRGRLGWQYRITAHELPHKAILEPDGELPSTATHEHREPRQELLSEATQDLPWQANLELPPEATPLSIKENTNRKELKKDLLRTREAPRKEGASVSIDDSKKLQPNRAHTTKKIPAARRTFFAEDQPLDKRFADIAAELSLPAIHIRDEWEQCRDWHLANGRGTANAKATYRNWLKRSVKFYNRRSHDSSSNNHAERSVRRPRGFTVAPSYTRELDDLDRN